MDKLKLCPFCGSETFIFEPEEGYYRIDCKNSNCSMGFPDAWYEDKEELILDWNTRHYESRLHTLQEENAELKAENERLRLCIKSMKEWNNKAYEDVCKAKDYASSGNRVMSELHIVNASYAINHSIECE